MKCSKDKAIFFILSLVPVAFLLFAFLSNIFVTDTDALAYHLYYARVINEQNLNFFSTRPIPLDNSLGFGLSAYYPWLYPHLIASLNKFTSLSFDNASYLLAALLYFFLSRNFREDYKLPFVLFLMIPIVYSHLFLHGTNYFLVIVLGFLSFKYIRELDRKYSVIKFFLVSLLLINTHVLGLAFVTLFVLYEAITSRRGSIFLAYMLLLGIYFVSNYQITGSLTFPFLQSIFPHRNYDASEWGIVTDQLQREIRSEIHGSVTYYLLVILSFAFFVSRTIYLNFKEKSLVLILLAPSLLIFNLGFRHRILFLADSFFIFLFLLQKSNLTFYEHTALLYKTMCENLRYIFYIAIIALSLILGSRHVSNYFYEISHIGLHSVKNCFYQTVSHYSRNDIVLLSEIELMRIENPANIFVPDGQHYSEMSQLKTKRDFIDYLKENKIRYIAETPLSSKKSRFFEENAYSRFMPDLIKDKSIAEVKNCPKENGFQLEYMPYVDDPNMRWLIYEVIY